MSDLKLMNHLFDPYEEYIAHGRDFVSRRTTTDDNKMNVDIIILVLVSDILRV